MAALPSRQSGPDWRRSLVFAGGAAAGIALAIATARGGWRSTLPAGGQWLHATVSALSNPWTLATALFATAATAYVWWRDEIEDLLAELGY